MGELPEEACEQVNSLSIEQLEALGEALLEFEVLDELLQWLESESSGDAVGRGD
jgi:hypothetical protein